VLDATTAVEPLPRVVFVFAAATSDNAHFLGEREPRLLPVARS
jgi:hypothetical protein